MLAGAGALSGPIVGVLVLEVIREALKDEATSAGQEPTVGARRRWQHLVAGRRA